MTNFEYYKTLESAIKAYEKEKKELIYNIHDGVSAGRFINWLYETPSKGMNLEMNNEPNGDLPSIGQIVTRLNEQIGLLELHTGTSETTTQMKSLLNELNSQEPIANIHYQSIFDEALAMARTLQKIEDKTHLCAMTDGKKECGYSSDDYLSDICRILYSAEGYHMSDKYDMAKDKKENIKS